MFKNEVSALQRKRRNCYTDPWIHALRKVIGVDSDNRLKQDLWVKCSVFLILKEDVHVTTAVF